MRKVKQIEWGKPGVIPRDEGGYTPISNIRYSIGTRGLKDSLWLFGHGIYSIIQSIEEGKRLAQEDFEKYVMETFFE